MPDSGAFSFPDLLRERLAEGRPVQALFDSWRTIDDAIRLDPEGVTAAFGEAAQLDTSQGSATVAPRSALGFAVMSQTADIQHADAIFSGWFGDEVDAAPFRRLAKLAAKEGRAAGLVEACDGAAIAACAGNAEAADGWPLPADCRAALTGGGRRIVLMCFAPSRAGDLAARASAAFGLTPLEARLTEALIDAPNLEAAADRIGVGRETAREALKKAMRKSGARRSPDYIRRLMDLMCGDHPRPPSIEGVLAGSFGATNAEAKAAARFAMGLTAREVADELGVKEATVRGQLKAVFAKTGVNKAKDLVRLAAETSTLAAMTDTAETVLEPLDPNGRLRVVASGDRRIALTDYGPRSGKPVLVMHGAATGRRLAPALARALQARGYRPFVPQRPGYGLTDPADDPGGYLRQGADDMARILDALKLDRVKILVRDSSTPTGLTFANLHPDRVTSGVIVNPKLPVQAALSRVRLPKTMMGSVSRAFFANPSMIELVSEMLRRQTRTDLLKSIIRESLSGLPDDTQALATPEILEALVRDAQGMFARTSAGFASEHRAYVEGWEVPSQVGGRRWTVVECASISLDDDSTADIWASLPDVRFKAIQGAGMLVYFTQPDLIADIVHEA